MAKYLTADGDIRVDYRDDDLFTAGLTDSFDYSTSTTSKSMGEIEEEDEEILRMLRIGNRSGHYESFRIEDRIPETIKEGEFEGMSVSSYGSNNLYVAVGKGGSSSDGALRWTLNNLAIYSSSFVHLIHVYPEVRLIPSPLGNLPKEQVRPEQVEAFKNQETIKRKKFLQRFLDMCSTSKVKAETVLIESDNIAKAIIDLILILNIRKLVLGSSKSNLRRLRKGNGINGQILKSTALDTCDVKIICEGKEVMIDRPASCSSSPGPSTNNSSEIIADIDQKSDNNGSEDNEPVAMSPCIWLW